MKTKTILSIAVIMALPSIAMGATVNDRGAGTGDYAGYDYAWGDGYTNTPRYNGVTVTDTDKEHIASTAYVKDAYNDAIAAVNGLSVTVEAIADAHQAKLILEGDPGYSKVSRIVIGGDKFENILKGLEPASQLTDMGVERKLITAAAVVEGIGFVQQQLTNKRVKIYTTWDDDTDNATAEVAFVNASNN